MHVRDLDTARNSRVSGSEPEIVGIGSQVPAHHTILTIGEVVDELLADVGM